MGMRKTAGFKKMKTATILAVVGLALAVAGCVATGGTRDSGTHYAEKAVMPYIEKGECPGAISVLYKDGRQETACMGWANVERKVPMSMDRMFMQCSQTKGFCGVTMAMLVEEGKVTLDDPVSKYLPEFKTLWVENSNKDGVRTLVKAKNVLTIRDVLNHTGGFPFEIPAKQMAGGLGWPGISLRATALEAAACPILFEPGTKASYSNTGIDIAAAVIEVVTGKKWDVFLKERVLDPLGMKDATFQPTEEQLARSISLYEAHDGKPATFMAFIGWMPLPHNGRDVFPSAGAGLWITAQDQLKFYKMLMNLGVGENGVRILKAETVKNLLATDQRPAAFDKKDHGYSLGLGVTGDTGWFGHGGAWGTNCMVNWKTREMRFWVVQLGGNPRPWDADWNKAADEFLAQKVDTSTVDAYTGRTKQ